MSDDMSADEQRGTDPLRELGKQLPYDRPDAARRDAVRSSLLVAASEGRRPGARNRWLLVGGGFAAGALAAAAVAIIVLRSPTTPAPRAAVATIESSSAAEISRSTLTTSTGTDELVRVRSGKVRLAVPAVRTGDHVRLQTGDAEVEGSGAYEVIVTADALASVTVATGTATVRIKGQQQAVFLAAGETWRASVITADLDIAPAKPDVASDPVPAVNAAVPTTADDPAATPTPTTVTAPDATATTPSTATTSTPNTSATAPTTTSTRTTAPNVAAPATATNAPPAPASTRTTAPNVAAPAAAPKAPPTMTSTRTTAPNTAVPAAATKAPATTTSTRTTAPNVAAPATATKAPPATSTRATAPVAPATVIAPIKPDETPADAQPATAAARPSITAIAEPAVPAVTGNSPTEKAFRAGYALLRANKYTDAALELGKAAAGDGPLAADARYFQAVALTKAGRGAEAERALVQFIDRAPSSVRRGRAIVMLARLMVARGEPTSARAWFEEALRDADPSVVTAARAGLAALK